MIVLGILKIIGIVLGCILGLVIVLILLVCLVPIRYKLSGKGENSDIRACAGAGWLLGLLKVKIKYQEKKAVFFLSVAGIKLKQATFGGEEAEDVKEVLQEEGLLPETDISEQQTEKEKTVSCEQKQPAEISAKPESSQQKTEETENQTDEAAGKEKTKAEKPDRKAEEKEEKKAEKPAQKEAEKEEKKAEKLARKEAEKEEKKAEKLAQKEAKKEEKKAEKLARKAEEKELAFKEKVRGRIQKGKDLLEKIRTVKRFLEAKTTKRALRHIKAELLHLLNHIAPRVISGTVSFGLDDPADTAMVYGTAVPVAEALGKGKLLLTPEFYHKGIRFNLLIRGRIFLGYVVLCGLRLYLDQDIHKMVKVIRRYLDG